MKKKIDLQKTSGGSFSETIENGAEKAIDIIHKGWSKILGDKTLNKIWNGIENASIQVEKKFVRFLKSKTK